MKALIVVDVQNDFVTGALGSAAAQAIVPKVRELIEQFHNNGDAIYFTQDTHTDKYLVDTQEGKKLPVEHCMYETWGWKIVDGIDIPSIFKNNVYHLYKSNFGYNSWQYWRLSKYEEIWICGLVSSICVVTNALLIKTFAPEVPMKFIAYASAGLSPENHAAACEVMRSCQIEVVE